MREMTRERKEWRSGFCYVSVDLIFIWNGNDSVWNMKNHTSDYRRHRSVETEYNNSEHFPFTEVMFSLTLFSPSMVQFNRNNEATIPSRRNHHTYGRLCTQIGCWCVCFVGEEPREKRNFNRWEKGRKNCELWKSDTWERRQLVILWLGNILTNSS